MKKLITLVSIVALTVAGFQATAQTKSFKKFQVGLGLETALPMGKLNTAYNFGVGSTARFSFGLNNDFAITATSGVIAFIPKTVKGVDLKAQLNIPVKAGLKYRFAPKLYTLGEVGTTISRVYYPSSSGSMQSVTSNSFTYAANIGANLGKFDASLRYEGFKSAGFIGLRVGFNF